jgi:hypothetical protein
MNRFVVEAGKRVVGVAVRIRGGFRFFYSDPDFSSIDRKVFRRVKDLARAIDRIAARRKPAQPRPPATPGMA